MERKGHENMQNEKKRRFLPLILGFVMVMGMAFAMLPAERVLAEDAVSYISCTANDNKVTKQTESCSSYNELTNSTSMVKWGFGWYVASSDISIDRILVNGTANLILCDGCSLDITHGITLSSGNTLNIYGQSEGTGSLNVVNYYGNMAGIGGGSSGTGGIVTIHGGVVNVTGSSLGAGIGGGSGGAGGTVTIYGGKVTATGGSGGAGIGGGSGGAGGTVTIYGGDVTATGSENGAGIGAGYDSSSNGTLNLATWLQAYSSAEEITDENKSSLTPVPGKNGAISIDRNRYMLVEARPSSYIITIPATLTAAGSGWNAAGEISATGYLEDDKWLYVTASSGSAYALVNKANNKNQIRYKMTSADPGTTAYDDVPEVTSWDIETLGDTAVTESFGIVVNEDEYNKVPAGDYKDTVTFTATVGATPETLNGDTVEWNGGSVYQVPDGGVTFNNEIAVNGDVYLRLTDDLTVNSGIMLNEGATLNVCGNGTMTINGADEGGNPETDGFGVLILNSGRLVVKGGNGGKMESAESETKIGGAAINGNVTVKGGSMEATGGNGGEISNGVSSSTYLISGYGGTAINGNVKVYDGAVTLQGGNGGVIGNNCSGVGAGNGGTAVFRDSLNFVQLDLYGGTTTLIMGHSSSPGEGCTDCTSGAGGSYLSSFLFLGQGMTLYEGTDNTGTVLDGNTGTLREYEGRRASSMYAEKNAED